MIENLDASYGLVFSQPVLLALVEAGSTPRRRVPDGAAQRDAPRGSERRPFLEVLREDPEVLDVARRRAPRRVLRPQRALRERRPHLRRARRGSRRNAVVTRHHAPPPLHRQGPRALRGRPRPHAHGRVRPGLGVRRRAPRRDPRQGPGPHRDLDVLVRRNRATSPRTTCLVRSRPTSPRRRAPTSRAGRCWCGRPGRCGWSASPAATCSARAWAEYRSTGTVQGRRCPPGCARPSGSRSRSSPRRPRPRPATTSRSTDAEAVELVGADALRAAARRYARRSTSSAPRTRATRA